MQKSLKKNEIETVAQGVEVACYKAALKQVIRNVHHEFGEWCKNKPKSKDEK
jgi:hypothetical protein